MVPNYDIRLFVDDSIGCESVHLGCVFRKSDITIYARCFGEDIKQYRAFNRGFRGATKSPVTDWMLVWLHCFPINDNGVCVACEAANSDPFVLHLHMSVCPSVRLSVCTVVTFLVITLFLVTHSYVSQAIRAFLGLLPFWYFYMKISLIIFTIRLFQHSQTQKDTNLEDCLIVN